MTHTQIYDFKDNALINLLFDLFRHGYMDSSFETTSTARSYNEYKRRQDTHDFSIT